MNKPTMHPSPIGVFVYTWENNHGEFEIFLDTMHGMRQLGLKRSLPNDEEYPTWVFDRVSMLKNTNHLGFSVEIDGMEFSMSTEENTLTWRCSEST